MSGFYLKAPNAWKALRYLLLMAVLGPAMAGCGSIEYYAQAIHGHLDLVSKRRSFDRVLADPATPPALAERLRTIRALRKFAVTDLALPDNDSYLSYADIHRDFVVWNVFAAPEFSLEPHESCFLFVGCLTYRGYFSQSAAVDHARSLSADGLETYIGGVAAYSTLGWFADPVLNTMLRWDDERVHTVVLHELAHQKLYVKGDSEFNEAFATAVADEGYHRWQQHTGITGASTMLGQRDEQFIQLLLSARQELAALYARGSSLSAPQLRTLKGEAFARLRDRYGELRASWDGYAGYDDFMARDLNNAKLASIATYYALVPGFRAALDHVNGDLPRFYQWMDSLGGLDQERRHACVLAFTRAPADLSADCAVP
ncbi:MAG: aminopeptidase [Gammaproteobacteria bacterium]|nr:aminopeptidase [Gammaproteobacteria bacterium]